MAQVIIRNLDESTVAALKSRAAAHGRSLEQELRLLLANAAQPSRENTLAIAISIRGLGQRELCVDLDELIRADRAR